MIILKSIVLWMATLPLMASVPGASDGAQASSEAVSESIAESTSQAAEAATESAFDFGAWMASVFTPEVIASILSVITAIGAILKLVSTMKELAKHNKMSDEQIMGVVQSTISSALDQSKGTVVEPLAKDIEKILPVLDKFAKILALSQENTSESRVAILNLISEMGVCCQQDTKDTAEEAKKVVEEQKKEEEAKKESQKAELESVSSSYDGTSI